MSRIALKVLESLVAHLGAALFAIGVGTALIQLGLLNVLTLYEWKKAVFPMEASSNVLVVYAALLLLLGIVNAIFLRIIFWIVEGKSKDKAVELVKSGRGVKFVDGSLTTSQTENVLDVILLDEIDSGAKFSDFILTAKTQDWQIYNATPCQQSDGSPGIKIRCSARSGGASKDWPPVVDVQANFSLCVNGVRVHYPTVPLRAKVKR